MLISVGQFANVCAARRDQEISFLALRVWLAAHEQRAKRCYSKRKRFSVSELASLVRANVKSVERALRDLTALGLIAWSEKQIEFSREITSSGEELADDLGTSAQRPVPVPRRILRALFRHTRPAEVLAAIGHLVRCLFIRAGELKNGGLVKASTIARIFGIGERSVHSCRKWLTACGFLAQEEVHQLVLNRWGGKFVFGIKAATSAVRLLSPKSNFAPPSKTKSTSKSTSNNQINYKPAFAASGVQKEHGPTLRNITPEDLKKPQRLQALYRLAVQSRWLDDSEMNFRNFASAAVRANRAGGRVGAIFRAIVTRKLWHHITQEQENRAAEVLARLRRRDSAFYSSADAVSAQSAQAVSSCVGNALQKSAGRRPEASLVSEQVRRRELERQLMAQRTKPEPAFQRFTSTDRAN